MFDSLTEWGVGTLLEQRLFITGGLNCESLTVCRHLVFAAVFALLGWLFWSRAMDQGLDGRRPVEGPREAVSG